MTDVLDILEIESNSQCEQITKEAIIKGDKNKWSLKKKNKGDERGPTSLPFKKPEGMHRELYALLYSDNKDGPPIIPTDMISNISKSSGYKQNKVKLGLRKVRPWRWMQFKNPGRKDEFMLYHWRRAADVDKEYPFAKFAKEVQVPKYTDTEYQQFLSTDGWTKAETDHLFNLAKRFDLRFVIIQDHWDRDVFTIPRSVEDLKERYYNVYDILTKHSTPPGQEPKVKIYDGEHERKRKEQLTKLYNRTPEQVEEEQKLIEELRRIEIRKKEREKKTQDLQQLITGNQGKKTDSSVGNKGSQTGGPGRPGRGPGRKKAMTRLAVPSGRDSGVLPGTPSILESVGIKFPEIKSSGTSLRSQKMKLPAAVGQKKSKAIENLLQELNIELRPMPTEEICQNFNELRSDMVLLYELKLALASYEFELQTLKHQYEALQPGNKMDLPEGLIKESSLNEHKEEMGEAAANTSSKGEQSSEGSPKKTISEVIDVSSGGMTPSRKRKAALEQGNLLRKLKKN